MMISGSMPDDSTLQAQKRKGTGLTAKNPRPVQVIHAIISQNRNAPKELYHYTSMTVMDSLLTSGQFWASNIFYLNDAEEYYKGIKYLIDLYSAQPKYVEILREILNDNGNSSQGVFSLSFSTQNDNLHQWITYAKEGGVCIGLDNERLKKYRIALEGKENKNIKHNEYGFCKDVIKQAIYLTKKAVGKSKIDKMLQKALMLEIDNEEDRNTVLNEMSAGDFSDATKDGIKEYYRLWVSYCKHSAFEIEKEYRAVFSPIFAKHASPPTIFYHVTPSGIIRPFLKVGFKETEDSEGISPLPIRSIMIGPAGNQQSVFDSVVHRVRFGETNVWDYWEKDDYIAFKRNYMEYYCGAIQEYLKKNSLERIREQNLTILNQALRDLWRTSNKKRLKKDIKRLDSGEYFPNDNECVQAIKDKKIKVENEASADPNDKTVNEILKYIQKNHFFTKEGIWIKKSQIPYVF